MFDLDDLRRKRKAAADQMQECATAISALEDGETAANSDEVAAAVTAFETAEADFKAADVKVTRAETVEAAQAAVAASGDEANGGAVTVPAVAINPNDKGVVAGLMVAALASSKGDRDKAVSLLEQNGHSAVSAALSGATDAAGGVTIPRAQSSELIELLRPRVAVRASGARTVPMPAGELRHAAQNSSATAGYVGENVKATESQPDFAKIDQTFKKLTSLVPIGNSLLRHTSTAMAGLVRDDLLKVMALREDLAFIRGDGVGNTPIGLLNWIPAANWLTGIAATPAVVDATLRSLVSKVEDADVGMVTPGWIMRAATKNFLASLRDAASGVPLYPSITTSNMLLGFPIKTTSQIPNNLGVGVNETEVYFGDFDEVMIGDSMQIIVSSSAEAAYVDAGGNTVSAFQNDLTLMRAISEHDLAPRHDVALSGAQCVAWTL